MEHVIIQIEETLSLLRALNQDEHGKQRVKTREARMITELESIRAIASNERHTL